MKLQDHVQVAKLAEKAREIIEILGEDSFVWQISINRLGDMRAMIDIDVNPTFVALEDVYRNSSIHGGDYYSALQHGIDFWTIYKRGENERKKRK